MNALDFLLDFRANTHPILSPKQSSNKTTHTQQSTQSLPQPRKHHPTSQPMQHQNNSYTSAPTLQTTQHYYTAPPQPYKTPHQTSWYHSTHQQTPSPQLTHTTYDTTRSMPTQMLYHSPNVHSAAHVNMAADESWAFAPQVGFPGDGAFTEMQCGGGVCRGCGAESGFCVQGTWEAGWSGAGFCDGGDGQGLRRC